MIDGPHSDERYRRRRLTDFATILAGAGLAIPAAQLTRGYEVSTRFLERIWSEHRDVPVEEHVRAIVTAADSKVAARLTSDILAALVDAYSRPAIMVPPAVDHGARVALRTLRDRGYRLAVVSNTMRTPGRSLRKLLARCGLLEYFTATVFSDEIGVRKPDAAIFLHALREAGGEPAGALHVGDDPILDVAGARAAGMRVIQVASAAARGGRSADATIPHLAALPATIAALESP